MKVYIVHYDVAYEEGLVWDVCATQELAEKSRTKVMTTYPSPDPEEWTIQEFEVTEEPDDHS